VSQGLSTLDAQLINFENSIAIHSFPDPELPVKRYDVPTLSFDFILVKRLHTSG
jgi:hypothetical protein